MKLRPLDWCALCLSLCVSALVAWQVYGASGKLELASIRGPEGSWVYPFDTDRELTVSGPLGQTHIVIRGGSAFVADSPCRDKLCVSMGGITRRGGWIACLPNHILLRADAAKELEVDAAAF